MTMKTNIKNTTTTNDTMPKSFKMVWVSNRHQTTLKEIKKRDRQEEQDHRNQYFQNEILDVWNMLDNGQTYTLLGNYINDKLATTVKHEECGTIFGFLLPVEVKHKMAMNDSRGYVTETIAQQFPMCPTCYSKARLDYDLGLERYSKRQKNITKTSKEILVFQEQLKTIGNHYIDRSLKASVLTGKMVHEQKVKFRALMRSIDRLDSLFNKTLTIKTDMRRTEAMVTLECELCHNFIERKGLTANIKRWHGCAVCRRKHGEERYQKLLSDFVYKENKEN